MAKTQAAILPLAGTGPTFSTSTKNVYVEHALYPSSSIWDSCCVYQELKPPMFLHHKKYSFVTSV